MIQHLMYNTLTVGVYGMIESKIVTKKKLIKKMNNYSMILRGIKLRKSRFNRQETQKSINEFFN